MHASDIHGRGAQTSSPTIEKIQSCNEESSQKEIIKWMDGRIIYPISDNMWVSSVQYVPKKGWMAVVTNEKKKLIPTRTVTR